MSFSISFYFKFNIYPLYSFQPIISTPKVIIYKKQLKKRQIELENLIIRITYLIATQRRLILLFRTKSQHSTFF